mgnify:CR=1 FL=1
MIYTFDFGLDTFDLLRFLPILVPFLLWYNLGSRGYWRLHFWSTYQARRLEAMASDTIHAIV